MKVARVMGNQELDRVFRERLAEYHDPQYNPAAWTGLQAQLPPPKGGRRSLFWWLFVPIGLLITWMGVGFWTAPEASAALVEQTTPHFPAPLSDAAGSRIPSNEAAILPAASSSATSPLASTQNHSTPPLSAPTPSLAFARTSPSGSDTQSPSVSSSSLLPPQTQQTQQTSKLSISIESILFEWENQIMADLNMPQAPYGFLPEIQPTKNNTDNSDIQAHSQVLHLEMGVLGGGFLSQLADAEPTVLPAIEWAGSLQLRPGLRLFLGAGYMYQAYERRSASALPAESIQRYIEQLSTGVAGSLEEIYMQAHTLQFPLGLQLQLAPSSPLNPYLRVGSQARYWLWQQYTYEFEEDETEVEIQLPASRPGWQVGTLLLGLGGDLYRRGPWSLQVRLQAQIDVLPQGIDQIRTQQFGAQAGLQYRFR